MYTKTQTDIFIEDSVKHQERALREKFANNYRTQQATLDLFKKSIEHCDINNFKENRVIWNFAGFINIISYDLKIIGENLSLSKDEWGKRFFARQSALLIYEALDDILYLSGKEFRNLLNQLSNSTELNEELRNLTKEINLYKQEHLQYLKPIRHNCAAHRDKDSIEQLKIIASINWSESISYLMQFDKILMSYGEFVMKVINSSLQESKELKEPNTPKIHGR